MGESRDEENTVHMRRIVTKVTVNMEKIFNILICTETVQQISIY